MLKVAWGKHMACLDTTYDHANMTRDTEKVSEDVARRLSSRIIYAAESTNARVLAGELV